MLISYDSSPNTSNNNAKVLHNILKIAYDI